MKQDMSLKKNWNYTMVYLMQKKKKCYGNKAHILVSAVIFQQYFGNWISALIKVFSELYDLSDKKKVWNIFNFINHTGEKQDTRSAKNNNCIWLKFLKKILLLTYFSILCLLYQSPNLLLTYKNTMK